MSLHNIFCRVMTPHMNTIMTICITSNLKMEYTRARPEGLHSEISSDDELVQAQSSAC